MARARRSWITLVALAAFLLANVAVRGIHHHAGPLASHAAGEAQTAFDPSPVTSAADDGDHTCQLCTFLHLVQSHDVEDAPPQVAVASEDVAAPAPPPRPHPLPSSGHSRAPPA